MSTLFSLACLFVLALVDCGVVASSKRWDFPANQCQITLGDDHFNICPLLNGRRNPGRLDLVYRYEAPRTITTIVYNISLNGPIPHSVEIPDDEQCVSGTWACVTTRKHHPHPERDLEKDDRGAQVTSIVMEAPQSDPRLDSSSGDREAFGIYVELRESVRDKSPSFTLHMRGGNYVEVPQRVQIDFECAESHNDGPNLSGVRNGTHLFTWVTKHACPQLSTLEGDEGSDSPPENEESNDPPPDAEEPSPNQDLLFPPVPPTRNGPTITLMVVGSGAALLGLGYLAMRPPAVLRKRIRELRRARLLQGTREARLLRWAAEELEMLGGDDDEHEHEVDDMVNSRALPDEEVPLRPSRIHPAFANYGTAD